MIWDQIKSFRISESWVKLLLQCQKCKVKDQGRKRKNSNLRQFSRLWQGMEVGQLFPSAAILLLLLPNIYPGAHIHIYPIYLSCKTYDMGIVLYILYTSYTPWRSLFWILSIKAVFIYIPPIMVLAQKTSHRKGCLQKTDSGFDSKYFLFKERRSYRIVGYKQNIE